MSSREAMEKWTGDVPKHRAAEGKEVLIPYKGPVEDVLYDICGGIRSACTYAGARRLKDLPKCAEFCRVTKQSNEVFGKN